MAVDNSPIIVNLNDNVRLQYNGANVKMKATVIEYRPVTGGKDFFIRAVVSYWENLSGAYGNPVIVSIANDVTLSSDQAVELTAIYADRTVEYTTAGKFADASGNIVPQGTPGSTTELEYWQNFKINQIPNMLAAGVQGALDAEYKIIQAIIAKLDARKKW